MAPNSQVVTDAEGRELLALAREALEQWVRHHRRMRRPNEWTGALAQVLGSFVSLHTREGNLRGCIGHMQGNGALGDEVMELAVEAGVHDPRFEPVSEAELPDLVYEISVLSPMRDANPGEVTPGRHGLWIRRGNRAGVLLPQVAVEAGWDRETFLRQTCNKAGLPPDAWRDGQTEIRVFEAQVIHE